MNEDNNDNSDYELSIFLKNKQLACWCKDGNDEPCHGDISIFLICYHEKYGNLDDVNFNI